MTRVAIALLAAALHLAACTSPPTADRSPGAVPSSPPPSPSPPTPAPAPSVAVATPPDDGPSTGDGPPSAVLSAEGGDPVSGQLGTYTWRETGSDSPWLPGAPIRAGAGEPLSISIDPPTDVMTWQARYVPATADGPDGATSLGQGSGSPAFEAPAAGSWTIHVRITFAGGAGDANYFWRLDVT